MRNLSMALGCLLVVGALNPLGGCAAREEGKGAAAHPPVVQGAVTQVVRMATVPDALEAVGTIRARTTAQIAARIAGTVTAVHVREGDRVGRGALLVSLTAAESSAGAAAAAAAVEEADRGVAEARARKRLADATFERYRKLFEEQAVTRQEFDGKSTEKEVADQGLARSEARLSQARETARAASTVAGYTRVTAPLGGIVTAKAAEVGMTVFPGSPLVTLEEGGSYRLEVAAPETLLGRVRTGDRLRVALDGVGEMQGQVVEVAPAVDALSRTFTVKAALDAKGLRTGMYGRAWFPVGERQGIFVPRGAVVERGALTSVWVVDEKQTARMRLVKTGKAAGERVEVIAGLSDGERVVTSGAEKVADGARVEQ